MPSENLVWPFLQMHLQNGTYGDKLEKSKETEDGFIFGFEAMNQKNSLMKGKKEEHLAIFADYEEFKGRPKPVETEEYTNSRARFLNAIVKGRCLPCGGIYKLSRKKVKLRGITVRNHFLYFEYSQSIITKRVKRDEGSFQRSKSAPASPAEFSAFAVGNELENRFPYEPGEAVILNSTIPVAKKRSRSVDVLQELCDDLGITTDSEIPEKKLRLETGDCRNSPVMDVNNDYIVHVKEEMPKCNTLTECLNNGQMYICIASNIPTIAPKHASQEPPLDCLVADHFLSGPLQQVNPDDFINFDDEEKENKEKLDFSNDEVSFPDGEKDCPSLSDLESESNFDLDLDDLLEDLCMEIPRDGNLDLTSLTQY